MPEYDAVVVIDYGHGLLDRYAVDTICRKSRFLAVNAQSNAGNQGYHTISKYPRADYVTLAENEARLDARDRELIERVYLLGETYEEASRASGVALGTLKRRLREGLGLLRRRLEGAGDPK